MKKKYPLFIKKIIFFLGLIFLILFLYKKDDIKKLLEIKKYSEATTKDWKYFNHNLILKSDNPYHFKKHTLYNKIALRKKLSDKLKNDQTTSFIILKEGELFFEKYWDEEDQLTNTYSITKAITILLLGFAIEDGYIKSLDQPILDFIPEYKGKKYTDKVRIINLIQMNSGLKWSEEYKASLSSDVVQAYYGDDINKLILSLSFSSPVGKFEYLSGNTQLLGFILKRAIGKPLSQYLREKLWNPLGMNLSSLWATDSKGVEKTFCCIYSNAIDLAKLGQLFLQKGKWNTKQLINEEFINKMLSPNPLMNEYGLGIWLDYNYKNPFFVYTGYLGQYIFVIPDKKIVFVRLGKKNDNTVQENKKELKKEFYLYVDEVLSSISSNK